jgi:hypothetical protein
VFGHCPVQAQKDLLAVCNRQMAGVIEAHQYRPASLELNDTQRSIPKAEGGRSLRVHAQQLCQNGTQAATV